MTKIIKNSQFYNKSYQNQNITTFCVIIRKVGLNYFMITGGAIEKMAILILFHLNFKNKYKKCVNNFKRK